MDLRIGEKYRVIYQIDGVQRYPRYSVMIYIGEKRWANQVSLVFSARPIAGTQEIELRQIKDIFHVKKSTPIVLNKDARKLGGSYGLGRSV